MGLAIGLAIMAAASSPLIVQPGQSRGPCLVQVEGVPSAEPPPDCASAIAAARSSKEKAILYFSWAYSLNEAGAALQSLPNLDTAIELEPDFVNALHERSYTRNDLGDYRGALADSNREIALVADSAASFKERSFAKEKLADFEGSLADLRHAAQLAGSSAGMAVGMARLLMWLGRYEEARQALQPVALDEEVRKLTDEIGRRLVYRPDDQEKDRCRMRAELNNRSFADKAAAACTWLFDRERDPKRRADYLTTRAIARNIALQDRAISIPDYQVAAAIDSANPQRHFNLGSAYLSVNHSWAARNELDTALASPTIRTQDRAMSLAARGQANFNLGEIEAAKKDIGASMAIQPTELALAIGGEIAFKEGDKSQAKAAWLGAYQMGMRGDYILEKLKSVGVDEPHKIEP